MALSKNKKKVTRPHTDVVEVSASQNIKALKKSRRVEDGIAFYRSNVVDLVHQIETYAKELGLTVSRWRTSVKLVHYSVVIHWAIHEGYSPATFKKLKGRKVLCHISLRGIEGKTKNCDAYRQLQSFIIPLRARMFKERKAAEQEKLEAARLLHVS